MTASDSRTCEPAIRDLVARYADAVNRRDEPAWSETWARDSEWFLLGTLTEGRDAIVAHWLALMQHLPFVLQLPVFGVVEVPPDAPSAGRATGRWYIQEFSQRPSRAGMTLGVYHDDYVFEEGAWRFARRRFDVLYRGLPDLSGETLAFPSPALVRSNDAAE